MKGDAVMPHRSLWSNRSVKNKEPLRGSQITGGRYEDDAQGVLPFEVKIVVDILKWNFFLRNTKRYTIAADC